jgi:hypothetical protein
MKVLYVFNFEYPDYQSDTIYHGLIENNIEVYETHYPSYMLSSFDNLSGIYGKGFTMFGKLNYTPRVEPQNIILEKIKSRFYDIIIYGCVYTHDYFPKRQCLDYIDEVKKYYPKEKVHFIDGSDDTWNYAHSNGLSSHGIIWKTHLIDYGAGNPISFGIPETQLIKNNPNKEKLFATIIPGNLDTYVFNNEVDYYKDYAKSYYGITWKKAQWETMRHYEILANKCIPYFSDIEDCPPLCMINFPKELIKETNKYARRNEIHPNYNEINDYLFNYTKNNLTTKKVVKEFLNGN